MTGRRVVWMFSGQGSQYPGMGRELYEQEPVFRAALEECDRLARPRLHASLADQLYGGTAAAEMEDTRLTHPAIFAIQYATARLLQSRGLRPDLLLGYSLGELVAHVVAEAIPLAAALELVQQHADLVESSTPPGGMLAVLATPDSLRSSLAETPGVWLAAHNFANHCVVSGTTAGIAALQRRLEASQVTVLRLPVRRAFHTPLMDPVAPPFRHALARLRIEPPRVRCVSATAVELSGPDRLWRATREPVEFLRAVRRLDDEHPGGLAYIDLGPSGTLATFVKYVRPRPESACFPILTPWGGAMKNLRALEAAR